MSGKLRSMTGYAEAKAEEHGLVLHVGVRSVNHRFLDLHMRLPEGLESLETLVRRVVRERVRRGHLDLFIRLESTAAPAVHINRPAAKLYLNAIEELKAEFDLREEPNLGAIFRLPGVVETGSLFNTDDAEYVGKLLEQALGEALGRLDQMRQAEGARLGEEMTAASARLAASVEKLEELGERGRAAYAARLRERIAELLTEPVVDPGRLAQEAALVAARSDATEEAARLRSHLEQFSGALRGAGEAGKKLDFLCQEMLREVNTTLSKAPALGPDGLEITRLGLEVKGEIEKLREQVQNIE
jgi:uncharacterized protein (TIGR00255 family)